MQKKKNIRNNLHLRIHTSDNWKFYQDLSVCLVFDITYVVRRGRYSAVKQIYSKLERIYASNHSSR